LPVGRQRSDRLAELPCRATAEGAGPALAQVLPARSEIDPAYQWRLEDIFPDDAAWEAAFRDLQAELPRAASFRGRLGEGPEVLLQALRLRDAMGQALERLFAYAHMHSDEDTRVSTYQAMSDRVSALATQLEGAWAYFEPELLALPEERLRAWVQSPPPEAAGLEVYRHKLDDLLRQKPHVLSAPEEELLARAGELARAPQTIFSMLNDADLTFPQVHDEEGRPVELTKARFIRFLESRSRRVREEAFRTLYATYAKQRNTLGAILAASVKRDWFYAQARRYRSCLEMALDADNVPVAVYENLIAAVRAGLPALHRYLRLRRRALGLDRLHMYDLYVPLVEEPRRQVPWEEAVRLVEEGLAPLGEDYVRRYRQGTSSGWVDVYENQGKTGGAYSWGVYGVHPYILMNYQGTVDHVFTLAHEFGHALHSHLASEAQPYTYAGYSIFVAEVASTVNEALLMHHLLERAADRQERAYLVNHYLEGFRTTVFRQVMFAEFEKIIHEMVERGEALTAESLSAAYRELNLAYYGPEVEVDPEIDLEWARIPHFYRAFYVYKYATGFSAAQALAEAVRREGAPARERYLNFLRSGSSRYPVDLLRDAGVDMASPEPVRRALGIFARLVEEMETLVQGPAG
jgi:oligoendopeptidase F